MNTVVQLRRSRSEKPTVQGGRAKNTDYRQPEYLTEAEVAKLGRVLIKCPCPLCPQDRRKSRHANMAAMCPNSEVGARDRHVRFPPGGGMPVLAVELAIGG
jgi:hypothetical protein